MTVSNFDYLSQGARDRIERYQQEARQDRLARQSKSSGPRRTRQLEILQAIQSGELGVEEAMLRLSKLDEKGSLAFDF